MSDTTNQPEPQLTDAQIKDMRQKTLAYYKDQISILKYQCEFEELKTRIETARFDALEARVKYLQLSDGIKKATEEPSEESSSNSDTNNKE